MGKRFQADCKPWCDAASLSNTMPGADLRRCKFTSRVGHTTTREWAMVLRCDALGGGRRREHGTAFVPTVAARR
jgi:hypothetical protein